MSESCPDVLHALRQRERDLELQACAIRARVEEVRETILLLERPPRRGRPRKLDASSQWSVVSDQKEDADQATEITEGNT